MAKDKFHDIVKEALEKEGWLVTDDAFQPYAAQEPSMIDLESEPVILAEKEGEKIAVEVKSFTQAAIRMAFYEALGQYLGYSMAMKEVDVAQNFYLAISKEIRHHLEDYSIIKQSIKEQKVKLLIFDLATQKIIEWIK